ncbi:MAG: GntR family transcriptional regulator [Gemmiger sp.]|nr:GntR family transcriptional regulator [Gemmiger sp.]
MPKALHQQAAQYIQNLIDQGSYPVGSRLPTENELAETLGVSRPTVRQALARLASEGVLNRIKGSGTFVAAPKLLHESTRFLASYRAESEKNHRQLRTEVLELATERAGEGVAARLGLPAGTKVTKLVRRRRVEGFQEGRPVVYTTVYAPYALYPEMETERFTDASLYDALEKRGLGVRHATRTLEVLPPPEAVRAQLELPPFEPAIFIASTGTDAAGRTVEYAESYYPAGCSRFVIEIAR